MKLTIFDIPKPDGTLGAYAVLNRPVDGTEPTVDDIVIIGTTPAEAGAEVEAMLTKMEVDAA